MNVLTYNVKIDANFKLRLFIIVYTLKYIINNKIYKY